MKPITNLNAYLNANPNIICVWGIKEDENFAKYLDLEEINYLEFRKYKLFFESKEEADDYIHYCSCEYGNKEYSYTSKVGGENDYIYTKIHHNYCPVCGKKIKRILK